MCAVLSPSVIGRGGEQINKLQSETGARIQVAPGIEIFVLRKLHGSGIHVIIQGSFASSFLCVLLSCFGGL